MEDLSEINITHPLRGNGSTSASDAVRSIPSLNNDKAINQTNLMEKIAHHANLRAAFKSVKRNKGAPGCDHMTIKEMEENLSEHLEQMRKTLLDGTFRPSAVKGVKIPKGNGKYRQLGIPTVIDRVVQQAIVQVLTPIIDPSFSKSSFGFRPKRSAHDAIKAASAFVKSGKTWVVDIDLEHFFDNVNHDKLMSKLTKLIGDKMLLKLIHRFLKVGLMQDGLFKERTQGTPQGGPLSPLLSNIVLADLDTELEKRGHSFVRYADDCNIYVQSKAAAERVMKSISQFIEVRLKLKVNADKTAADHVYKRQFLSFRIDREGQIAISKDAISKFKDKIRKLTKRNRGRSLNSIIQELNSFIKGWFQYFKMGEYPTCLKGLDGWIRRRLRCYRLKLCKRKFSIKTWLEHMGINTNSAWTIACARQGWWGKSLNKIIHKAMNREWFIKAGLVSLHDQFVTHKSKTAVCDSARTVV